MRLLAFAAFLALAGTLAAPARAANAVDAPTRTVTVGTATVAYRTLGSGPPLLLLNRFRGTLDTWDPAFLDALARHRTLYLFDLPGIGYSEGVQPDSMEASIALVDGFADALGLREFDLLGWSWGGLLAQAYAVDRPGRVGKLVLLATNPPGHNEIPLQPAFLERALKPVNDLADEEVLFFEPASAASRQAAKASRERIHQREGVDAHIPSDPAQFERYFKAAGGFHADPSDRRARLGQLALPMLVIAGDHDTSTAGQNWFPLVGSLGNARFVFYSRTGHAPHHQHPDEVAELIGDFLRR